MWFKSVYIYVICIYDIYICDVYDICIIYVYLYIYMTNVMYLISDVYIYTHMIYVCICMGYMDILHRLKITYIYIWYIT